MPIFSYFILNNLDLELCKTGFAVPTLNRSHVHEFLIPSNKLITEIKLGMGINFKHINLNEIRTLEKLRKNIFPNLKSCKARVA